MLGSREPREHDREGPVFLNVGLFYVGWFAAAWGAARGLPLLGPAIVLLILPVHVRWVQRRPREFVFLGLLTPTGYALDTLVAGLGFLAFPPGQGYGPLPPLWIGALWLLFGTLFDRSLRGLLPRPLLAAVLGAGGGPLAYYTGARLGAILLPKPLPSTLLVLSVEWALAMFLAVELGRRLLPKGRTAPPGHPPGRNGGGR